MKKNIRISLRFDGTDFHGWQIQPGKATIQGELCRAIKQITKEDVTVYGCGRTDAGVHARNYIASFMTESNIPPERIPYALNASLPDGIVCTGSEIADIGFNAARSAVGKTYIYTIDNGEFPDAFLLRYAWHCRYQLDVDAMRRAAKCFCGTHDFIGFAASGFTVKTTVRTINSLDIAQHDDKIIITVTGNGFLYNMVRIIVGTLVYVGSGRISPDDIPQIIESRDRSMAGITAPAKGLCLKEVFY